MMSDPNVNQNLHGDKNILTATGNIFIYNYYGLSPATEQSTNQPDNIPLCPYRGLFAFGPEHASIFFGREKTVENLLSATEKQKFTALIGASGSGKSSVVLAGLVPKLHLRGQCLVTHFRPTDDPFLSLARALLPLYHPSLTPTDMIPESLKLAELFRSGRLDITNIVSTIHHIHADHRIYLIADQFEELFTLSHDTLYTHKFIDLLLGACQSNSPHFINLVLMMRADFLNQASLYRPLADAMQGANEILGPMTREELMRAIEVPAKQLGVTFEDGLTTRILDDVGGQSGNLPLLEFALTELWGLQHKGLLTHHAYSEIGEVSGALSRYADGVLNALSEAHKLLARRIFIQLVKPGQGTEDTRRLATRTELGSDNWPLVAQLATKRLITTNANQGSEETAELIHEALIRSWSLLKNWLNEDRNFRVWQERLRNDLKEWLDSKKADTALMRSFSLAEARHWLTNRPHDISPAERELIETSLLKHQRQEQQRFLTSIGTIVAIIVITILVIFNLALLSRL